MGTIPLSKEAWVLEALERYEQRLLRYAARITGDLELARDVVQDTFLRLCGAERAEVDSHLAAWLYTVCRNRALDVRKKEGRMSPLDVAQAEARQDAVPGPDAVAERNETHALVLAVLDTLPENQQEAFRLKFENELTYREIGKTMDVSLGTVSNLIAGALTAIRERLRSETDLAQEVEA